MEKADVERPRPLMSVSGPWHLGVIQISDGQSWGLTGVMRGDEEWPPSGEESSCGLHGVLSQGFPSSLSVV